LILTPKGTNSLKTNPFMARETSGRCSGTGAVMPHVCDNDPLPPVGPPLNAGERWFAWEGMAIAVPGGWDPAVLQKGYLRLEDERRPTLEMRWRFSPGSTSIQEIARAYISRLEKSLGGRAIPAFEDQDPIPGPESYEMAPFSVETGEMIFRGAVVLCPRCRRVAVLQMGSSCAEDTLSVPARIVSSFRDYHSSDRVPWTLFDIRADVPGGYQLQSHSFKSGYFRMSFRRSTRWLTLHRWAPADVILRRTTLMEWAAGQYQKEIRNRGRDIQPRSIGGFPGVEIVPKQGGSMVRQLGRALMRAGSFRALLWHNESANRLLGVETTGGGRDAHQLLCDTAERFRVVKEIYD